MRPSREGSPGRRERERFFSDLTSRAVRMAMAGARLNVFNLSIPNAFLGAIKHYSSLFPASPKIPTSKALAEETFSFIKDTGTKSEMNTSKI